MSAGWALAVSVLMHVTWNLIARQQPRASNPLWWVLAVHLVLVAPFGVWALVQHAEWSPRLVGLLALSATANMVYFAGLARAYEYAPVALVYPLVRSSPLLIAVWGSVFFGQHLPPLAWAGIAVSVAGLWIMASSARGGDDRRALPSALLAMLATSVYSLSDKAATAQIPSFLGLIGFLSVGYTASWAFLAWTAYRRSGRWIPAERPGATAMLVGGLCIGLAYALVIHAMREMTAAEAVSYTNAGIVLATVSSIVVFHEHAGWRRRLGGALIITIGLATLALGRS
ncbi:EamA family transporter [Rhodocyclaceae bacterium SMB388]